MTHIDDTILAGKHHIHFIGVGGSGMFPIVQKFYAAPYLDMHNRMKEVLAHIGRLNRAVVRPPQCKITDREKAVLFAMADHAGLTTTGMKGLDW